MCDYGIMKLKLHDCIAQSIMHTCVIMRLCVVQVIRRVVRGVYRPITGILQSTQLLIKPVK